MMDETNKELCFAYIDDKTCGALEKKDCLLCPFYKFYIDEKNMLTKRLINEVRNKVEVNNVNKK